MESSQQPRHLLTSLFQCSTPCGINGIITVYHDRLARAQQACSTPCGINGIITRYEKYRLFMKSHVLNALRHQWNHHPEVLAWQRTCALCSTPCGINGIITAGARVAEKADVSAQRLAASMESSP